MNTNEIVPVEPIFLPGSPQHNASYVVESVPHEDTNERRHRHLLGAWLLSLGSAHTRDAYRRDAVVFLDFLDTGRTDLLSVSRKHIDLYRVSLESRRAASSVARMLSALGSLYAYLVDEGQIAASPMARVKRPRVDRDASTTSGLTASEAKVLLQTAQNDSARSYALVSLLLMTGCRVSELLGARFIDLSWDSGYRVLSVTRKGGRRQKMVLPAAAQRALTGLHGAGASGTQVVHADEAPSSGLIFTTATGHPWQRSEAFRTVRRLARVAGIRTEISPHSLRHTYATLALAEGASLQAVQDSLGHTDPRTTRRYDRARNNLDNSPATMMGGLLATDGDSND